jgi:putative salt-induced outer membrane protein YdiY
VCASTLLLADQVVLKNGDTITGSVIKKDGAKLTLKSEFLGEVSIPWTAIKSLKSDQELTVVLPTGESVKGKIATNGDNLDVAAAGGEKTAPLATVTAVRDDAEQAAWQRLQHPSLFQLWAGNYNFGLALARGNARTASLTNTFNATRATTHDKIILNFNQIYASALVTNVVNGVSTSANNTTANSVRGGGEYDRNLNPKIFLTVNNSYEHDRFQNLNLRAVIGGGVGWNAAKTDKLTLSVQGGGDFNRENYMNAPNQNVAEVNFGDDLLYKFTPATSVTQDFRIYPNLSDTGQYRMNFDLSAVTAIKKWLGFNVTFSDHYISNPVAGRLGNDVLLSTGFRVTFAH